MSGRGSTSAQAEAWRELIRTCRVLSRRQRELAEAIGARDAAVLRLRALGFTYQAVADAAGLTRGRVAQIVSRAASPA